MGRRIRILLAVWSLWWFGYMAPAHERGFVRVDGGCGSACCEPRSCCDPPADSPCDEQRPDDPVRTCAMCRLLAKLDTPPAVSLAPTPVGLIDRLDPPSPVSVDSIDPPFVRCGRAPPFVM